MYRFGLTKFLLAVLAVTLLIIILHARATKPRLQKDVSDLWTMIDQGRISRVVVATDHVNFTDLTGQRYQADFSSDPKGLEDYIRQYNQTLLNSKATLKTGSSIATGQQRHPVDFAFEPRSFLETYQPWIGWVLFPLILVGALYMVFMRQAQSTGNQAMLFGRARARRVSDSVSKITFDDVAGVDEAKQELQEIVEFLRNRKKFEALGAKVPKGVLLLGPPGCGKTMLARAIAGEADVPFWHISGSDFVEMFVGVGASRVRDLFETAKASAPSLIFIDEIDAVGRQRGAGLGGGHDEREQTLNQLLVEMDGFDPNKGVILVAATNRPDILDPALTRPGRFDRRITVDNPDFPGRKAILSVHARGKPLATEVEIDVIARRTPGFSGADLANLVNEAALLAARREKTRIDMIDFEESIDRVIAGPERRSRILTEREKLTTAVHEAGHAIAARFCPGATVVHKVSIISRGMALGYTITLPTEDKHNYSKQELLDRIAYGLGGRAAEQIVFSEMNTGCAQDLQFCGEIARQMVCEYGMSERLGPITFGRHSQEPFLGRDYMETRNYSEEIARTIDEEVRQIISDSQERALRIIGECRPVLDEVVRQLLDKETINSAEFEEIFQRLAPTSSSTPSET